MGNNISKPDQNNVYKWTKLVNATHNATQKKHHQRRKRIYKIRDRGGYPFNVFALIEGDYGYCYNQEKEEVKQSTEFDEYCNKDLVDFECDRTQNLYKADRNGRCPGPKNDPVNALSAMEDGFCRKPTWQPVQNCTTNYRVLGAGEEIRDFLCGDNHYSPHSGQCPDGFAITDDPDRCKYVGEQQSMQYNTKVGAKNYKKQLTYEQELAML